MSGPSPVVSGTGPAPASSSLDPGPFDLFGPLPSGTTVLEASAGTGKTFTIAALATRYVAEGVAELPELLLVTFGRAATSELRDRVRERLVSAERGLRGPQPRRSPDELVAHLAGVEPAELDRRRARLTRALSDFDAATIATTHGFCQQMLTSLGVAGDADTSAVLVPDVADLVEEVVDDVYLSRYATSPAPELDVGLARQLAAAAVGDPQARLEPSAADPGSVAGHRHALAAQVLAEVQARKRRRHLLDYDDLLTLLRDSLTHPEHGAAAAARVRSRYAVVLVDEFQDTDPVQWEVIRTAFHGHRTLVLIGDPKQAIYAFRGGDVVAYLNARSAAGAIATLDRSWRADPPLLTALDHLIGGTALGDPQIRVRPVRAAQPGRRLRGGPPVRLRQVPRAVLGVRGRRDPAVGQVRSFIAQDVAADVVAQLGRCELHGRSGWRPLRPADVAVLTRRNADAELVRDALAAAGVPAVISGLSSVFGTDAAGHWLTLLAALAQPGHAGRTAALALTPFVGWDAAELAGAPDEQRQELADRVRSWAHVLGEAGVAALWEACAAYGLAERLLRTTTGERELTDLRHVGQSLHLAALEHRLGAAAATEWLRRRIEEAEQDYAEDRGRRLETDAAAVQVVTVHASKGLEFPVVYVPFGWDRHEQRTPQTVRHHDDQGRRTLHVGGDGSPGYPDALAAGLAEDRGEDLRLLYVALTRACSQVVLWWAPSRNTNRGALTRVLLGARDLEGGPADSVPTAADDAVAASFADLAARSGGSIEAEVAQPLTVPARWAPPPGQHPPLELATLARSLDLTWRRTSYSGLTADAHQQATTGVSSEPEDGGLQDEQDEQGTAAPLVPPPAGDLAGHLASPMAGLPAGTGFGTLVHAVLERVDPSAADLPAELLRVCQEMPRPGDVSPAALAAALQPALLTPLGGLAAGRTLHELPPGDRLAELTFELPLAGGDAPNGPAPRLADLAALVERHLAADDVFADYPRRMLAAGLGPARLRGYLTGSIDAVLRVPGADGARYLVVDYKTNRLAPAHEELSTWHYRPPALAEAMMSAHYPLQVLLYSVALHRFLRWRQPGYQPGRHLGGGLYLFLRGMAGPATPVLGGSCCGVLAWRPPPGLVEDLSDLLDGGRR